jgi:cellulose synthase/poly-beta-1,6-N-acetylglucosamine synthase-like glycosyltransferase
VAAARDPNLIIVPLRIARQHRFDALGLTHLPNYLMHVVAYSLLSIPAFIGVYAYVLYPGLLWVFCRGARESKRSVQPEQDTGELPIVSIVIPAYNEELQIRGAIESALAQDYPADRRQILILSDASTDRTDDIVREFSDLGVELLRMPVRGGKTAAENASIQLLRGEVVINTDASIRLHRRAVRELVRHMADPEVGVASSRDVSIALQETTANMAEAGYVGYEMWVRALETRSGGIVGASGSGYAIRTSLHAIPVRDDLSRDFSAALTARTHGFISVSVDEALCYVPRTASIQAEHRRKVRTISRGMETLSCQRHLLNPFRYGHFAWKLLSHKVMRWLLPISAVPGLLGLLLLAISEPWARWASVAVAAALGVGLVGYLAARRGPLPRVISLITFGVSANVAVIRAAVRYFFGHEDHIWEPTRRSGSQPAQGGASPAARL